MSTNTQLPGDSNHNQKILPDGTGSGQHQNLTHDERLAQERQAKDAWKLMPPAACQPYSSFNDFKSATVVLNHNSDKTLGSLVGNKRYDKKWSWRQSVSFTELTNSLVVKHKEAAYKDLRESSNPNSNLGLGRRASHSQQVSEQLQLVKLLVDNGQNERLLLIITHFLVEEAPDVVPELSGYLRSKFAQMAQEPALYKDFQEILNKETPPTLKAPAKRKVGRPKRGE